MVKFAYVLPDPVSYKQWVEFKGDLPAFNGRVTTRWSFRSQTRRIWMRPDWPAL